MVTFYNYFVKCGPQASVSDVAEHIYYIRNLIGVDHIGVGGDFDGINKYVGDEINRIVELISNIFENVYRESRLDSPTICIRDTALVHNLNWYLLSRTLRRRVS